MAGSWSNSYQVSLTLPTGATTGARIVLDGDTDTILVYDSTDQLIASVSPTDSTDPAGNTVLQGITNYAGHEYVQLGFGNLLLGVLPDAADPTFVPVAGLLGIKGDSSSIGLQSATNQDLPDPSFIEVVGGVRSQGTGSPTYPHHQVDGDIWILQDGTGTTPTRSSTLIAAVVNAGSSVAVPETWHDVAMGTGWATGPGISGSFPPFRWRRDGLNNIHLFGTFHATSTTPSVALGSGLPDVNLTHLGGVSVIGGAARISATAATIPLYANDIGQVRSAAVPTLAVNDTFMVNASFPLGNVP